MLGTDIADVEVKNSHGGLPKSLRETLSAFSNTRGAVVILGLDEGHGFAPAGLPNPAKIAADLSSILVALENPMIGGSFSSPCAPRAPWRVWPLRVTRGPLPDPAMGHH